VIAESYDLRPWADAHRFRWVLEESYQAERDPDVRRDVAAFVEVRGQRGTLYPGGSEVCCWVPRRAIAQELLALGPEVLPHQTGDQEATLRFPASYLDLVAEIIRPRRRRQGRPGGPPPEARARGLAVLALRRLGDVTQERCSGPGSTIVPGCGAYAARGAVLWSPAGW
jgi:hypothetical protein